MQGKNGEGSTSPDNLHSPSKVSRTELSISPNEYNRDELTILYYNLVYLTARAAQEPESFDNYLKRCRLSDYIQARIDNAANEFIVKGGSLFQLSRKRLPVDDSLLDEGISLAIQSQGLQCQSVDPGMVSLESPQYEPIRGEDFLVAAESAAIYQGGLRCHSNMNSFSDKSF